MKSFFLLRICDSFLFIYRIGSFFTLQTSQTEPNIRKEEILAIKSQQGDENNIIIPVNEGNSTVVSDKVGYSKKLT